MDKYWTHYTLSFFRYSFCTWGGGIRSLDEGQNWEPVSGSWDSSGSGIRLLHIDTYHQAHVWTGGVSNLSQPVLWKSTDVGKSWQNLESIRKVERTIVEAVVYDVITHPVNPDITLAGLDGTITKARNIRKSTDGGESWELVLENTGIHTFTHSARTPTTVYASGHNTDGTLFFAASTDFGDSWEMIEMPDSPADIQINDIESVIIEGQEVLYLGTNKGVYSYRFEE